MKIRFLSVVGLMLVAMTGQTQAAFITPASVSFTGTGAYNNSLNLLTDGSFPPESQFWQADTVWWQGLTQSFTIDYGATYTIEDVLLSVDNNDSMNISYSTNGTTFTSLFTIDASDGEIGFGMDTMSTESTNGEYIAAIDFASVQARYLRIAATGGDNSYSVGEFQAFGQAASVPEPVSLAMWGFGVVGMALARRRRKRPMLAV